MRFICKWQCEFEFRIYSFEICKDAEGNLKFFCQKLEFDCKVIGDPVEGRKKH